MYADKGISALTLTTTATPYSNAYQKYSLLDREVAVTPLTAQIGVIAEALAQTFVI